MNELTVEELKEKMDQQEDFVLLDVREPHEFEYSSIDGSTLIPLGDLEDHLESLDKEKVYVVHCRSGKRSASAVNIMTSYGFSDVSNLVGGILSWAAEIDSSVDVA